MWLLIPFDFIVNVAQWISLSDFPCDCYTELKGIDFEYLPSHFKITDANNKKLTPATLVNSIYDDVASSLPQ